MVVIKFTGNESEELFMEGIRNKFKKIFPEENFEYQVYVSSYEVTVYIEKKKEITEEKVDGKNEIH